MLIVIIFLSIILLLWSCGTFLLWKIPFCKNGHSNTDTALPLSVIIPSRNEEKNIPRLLESLYAQTRRPDEIIVIDDQSDDDTAKVAVNMGARLMKITNKPKGWTGKTWACWRAANSAHGELLLFIDADTRFEPDGIQRILTAYKEVGGLVSVQPYHKMERIYEELSAFFNILIFAGSNAFTVFGKKIPPAGGFGPCILCHKKDYFTVKGHESVRTTILENFALGKHFLKNNIPLTCYGGKKTLFFRMYPDGIKQLINGWTKSFATGASYTSTLAMILINLWISGGFLAAGSLVFALIVEIDMGSISESVLYVPYLLYVVQMFWILHRIGNFSFWSSLLFPIHLIFFVLVFIRSFIQIVILKKVSWKKRTYNF